MKKTCATAVIVFVLVILSTPRVFADFFNNRNVLVGERAAMLGGAYTALSEDLSGSYYNPAGLGFVPTPTVSLSANIYSYRHYTREDNYGEAELRDFEIVPTAFGFCFNFDPCVIALSVYQTDIMRFSVLRSVNDLAAKIEIDTQTYLMGPSIGIRLGTSVSIGISVFYHYFQGRMILANENVSGLTNLQQNQVTSGGIVPMAGILIKLTDALRTGVRYSAETINTNGTNTYAYSNVNFSGEHVNGNEKGDIRMPHQIAWGVAWETLNVVTLSFDLIYYFKMEYDAPHAIMHTKEAGYVYSERAHWDASLGMEFFLSGGYSLRFGFNTNTSAATGDDATEKINMYGGSIGIGHRANNFTSGLGIGCMYGKTNWQEKTAEPLYPARWTRLEVRLIAGSTYMF